MDHLGLDREVAVVGLAGLFPKSRTVSEFWNHIVAQSDCIEEIPPSRWSLEDHFDSDQKTPDKTYSRRGGFVPEVDFDPMEFGLPPKTLESLDTAQMLALLVARDALADADYGAGRDFARERTGVILGVSGTTMKLQASLRSRLDFPHWSRILAASGVSQDTVDDVLDRASQTFVPWTEDSFPGMLANVVSGRIANRLNLGGINCAVDAACASALCAVNFAIGALVSRNCDMVITGGVDVDNSIQAYMSFSKTPVLSAGQRIRPFDAAADGTIISEAVAMLVLKRRSDAVRDGDRIYAVIRGVGVSSDGRCESIYAPRSEGQARALREAYTQAGVSPADVDLVEAHATGTQVGDAVEFRALSEVFGEAGASPGSVAVGSIKSQFGHAKAAAGALSLIKTVLSLHHKVLPPTINLAVPNPTLSSTESPFYFSTETRPWIARADGAPRRAGISASGFGGANYHVVLEEAQAESDASYRLHAAPWVGFVSAPTPDALRERCADLAARIERGASARELLTTMEPVGSDQPRIAFAAVESAQAVQRLTQCAEMIARSGSSDAASHPDGIWYRRRSVEGQVAALFPGQGSQYVNMGLALGLDFPEHRAALAQADTAFVEAGHESLSGRIYPKPDAGRDKAADERRLRHTMYAQTAVATMSVSTWKLLQCAGFAPHFALGHSLGELTALWAAGAIADCDILKIVRARGEAFTPAEGIEAGALTAVTGPAENLAADLAGFPDVRIANINAPRQTVIGGPSTALDAAEHGLEQKGYSLSRLPVAAAFHTPSVSYGNESWGATLQAATFGATAFPVCSNTTGGYHAPSADSARSLLARHPLEPVRFMECVERLYADGVRIFVEIGPRGILSRLVSQTLGEREHATIATNPNREGSASLQLQQAAAQLMVLGIPLKPVDRYQADEPISQRTPSGVSIKLDAAGYLLPETRRRMAEALSPAALHPRTPEPHEASRNGATSHEPARSVSHESVSPASHDAAQCAVTLQTQRKPVHMSTPLTRQPAAQDTLARLYELEHAQLDVHRQFLAGQQNQAALLSELARQHGALAQTEGGPQSWERVVERVVDHQRATVDVHRSYLDMQSQVAGLMIGLAQGASPAQFIPERSAPVERPAVRNGHVTHAEPAHSPATIAPPPSVPAPSSMIHFASAAPQPPAVPSAQLADQLLEIVSQKTGYPVDLIGLDSDLEADLGIDSIKRIEILASLPKANGDAVGKSRLSELRTLREILALLTPSAGAPDHSSNGNHNGTREQFAEGPATSPAAPSASLADQLLEIVSQKTGYPADLIGLDSDLEADLGIDSIKRIEILASLPKSHGESVGKSRLSELRTLREILTVMSSEPASSAPPAPMASGTAYSDLPAMLEGPLPGAVRLEPLPRPGFRPENLGQLPRRYGVLIVSDGTPAAEALAEIIREAGRSAATFDPGKLASADDAGVAQALQEATEKAGRIGAVIYLHRDEHASGRESLKLALLLAKHCGPYLREAAANGRPAFLAAVRMDGALGTSGSESNPNAGALFGLTKTLAQEWPEVFCRAVDLGPGASGQDAALRIAAELADPQTWPVEVAHTARDRSTLTVRSLTNDGAPGEAPGPETTFLVTGGARGVTAACAVAIASRFQCRLVLLGRTPIDVPEEQWSLGVSDHAELKRRLVQHLRDNSLEATPRSVEARFTTLIQQREAQTTIAAITRTGATVIYRAVDIADAQSLRNVLTDIGRIDGLIHGAGAIADSRIERKTIAEFDRVFAPKIDGLKNLMECLDSARLRHIVLFSSTAAVSGNAGQSDYAMANEILNKQAYELRRQLPGCRVVSICWGPWDGGMVTPELSRRFQARGIRTISKDTGAAFLVDRLLQGTHADVQVVLGDLLPPAEHPKRSGPASAEFPGVLAAAVAHDRADEEAIV